MKRFLMLLIVLCIIPIAYAGVVSPIHNYDYNTTNILFNLSFDFEEGETCNYTLNEYFHNFTIDVSNITEYSEYFTQSELTQVNTLHTVCDGFSDTRGFTTNIESEISFNQILIIFLFIFGLLFALVYTKFM